MSPFNLFDQIPKRTQEEEFRELFRCRNVTVERISSPPNTSTEWMIQKQDEWVALLQGKADVELENGIRALTPGDTLFIPAGTRHRVTDTSTVPCAVWLAIHIYPETS